MTATFWQHRLRCMTCGLHFTIHSDFEDWFHNSDLADEKASCPECQSKLREGGFMYWKAEVEGFIFEHVAGKDAVLVHIHVPENPDGPQRPDPPSK